MSWLQSMIVGWRFLLKPIWHVAIASIGRPVCSEIKKGSSSGLSKVMRPARTSKLSAVATGPIASTRYTEDITQVTEHDACVSKLGHVDVEAETELLLAFVHYLQGCRENAQKSSTHD